MEKIKVMIDVDGQVSVETKGFHGKGCLAASKFLEETLGNVLETKKTSEFYSEEQPEKVRIQNDGSY